jgi:aminomethyltransferase
MLKQTPLHAKHVALGAKMMAFAGYDMPVRYAGDTAEHLAVRQQVGLFDVSHMGEFLVRGAQALPLLQQLSSNDVSSVPVGKAQYSALTNCTGGIVDDMIIYRLEDELYMVVVNAANVEKDWAWFVENNQAFGADLKDLSEDTALLAVSGPNAPALVSSLTTAPLGDVPYYAFTRATMGGVENVLVATTGYTGERTFELFFRASEAPKLWDVLLEAGKPHGIQPIGLGARDTLRLEMGFMLYGNDIDDTTSPLQAGLGWVTKLAKADFNGKAAIEAAKAKGFDKKLIAFECIERGIPRHGSQLAYKGEIVGEVTSGTFSPSLKIGIGLGYVRSDLAVIDGEIDLVVRDVPVKARIVKAPFLKTTSLTGWK